MYHFSDWLTQKLLVKGHKKWNGSLGKWQTDYIVLKIIKLSKYEIARGYPATEYIVDKSWKIFFQIKSFQWLQAGELKLQNFRL